MQWSGILRDWSCGEKYSTDESTGGWMGSVEKSLHVNQGTTGGGSCLQMPHKQDAPWEKDKMSKSTEMKDKLSFFEIK